MATKNIVAGVTEINVSARCSVIDEPQQVMQVPGGLYPLQVKAFEIPEYRVMAGWPVEIPGHDIKIESLISCTGEVITARDNPVALTTDAMVRWVADSGYYSTDTLRWSPLHSDIGLVTWETTVENAPVLVDDYEYRVGNERFYGDALNFDSDDQCYMSIDMSGYLSGPAGYTLIMVMSPNSVFSNNNAVPYNGIWSPQTRTGNWMDLTMQGQYLYLETESTNRMRGISVSNAYASATPVYVAVVFDRPTTTMYIGTGPNAIRVKTLPAGSVSVPLNEKLFLGRSSGDLLHTADMALFDLGLYGDRLTAMEISNQFAILSRAYGGE